MKYARIVSMAFVCSLMIASCSGNLDKEKGAEETTEEQPAEKHQEEQPVSSDEGVVSAKWEARKSKGDTLALAYKDLQAYLPEISGYTKDGSPKGSQMNMPGMGSWSQTEQRYVNGDKTIEVQLVDYNSAYQAMVGATTLYKMGFSAEDDTKKQGAVDLGIKDVGAYETIYKEEPRAELVLIIADRFFAQIESNGSNDADLIRSVAKSMKLDELASK
jgi:hypothetical protein